MPIPSPRDIQIPLLQLIYKMGGHVRPSDIYDRLADYFGLSEKERNELLPSGINTRWTNRVQWTRLILAKHGFLDKSSRGIWKISERGKTELSRPGLIDKPFPVGSSSQLQGPISPKEIKHLRSDDEEILDLVLDEIAPAGSKQFPDDFLDHKNDSVTFYEVELPGTQLHLASLSQTIITSPKGYFRYHAKNPPEAKFILYAHVVSSKNVKIPTDNLILFKAVKAYEKYCDEVGRRAFELFLEFTHDEDKAEELTGEVARRLGLKGRYLNSLKQL